MKKWQGVMAYIDRPSEGPAGGSYGLKIVITAQAAEQIIQQAPGTYLCDDHINLQPHFHPSKLIGTIDEAVIIDDTIVVSGQVDEKFLVKYNSKPYLGLSLEATGTNVEPNWRVQKLIIHEVSFKGVAVLEKPAFLQTSFTILEPVEN